MTSPPSRLTVDFTDRAWRSDPRIVGVRLRDLVADIDIIAAQHVPYARLPRRWSRFAEHYPTWSTLADSTLGALLGLPRIADSAIAALTRTAFESVQAARAASAGGDHSTLDAAVAALLTRLDAVDRTILTARRWTWQPLTTHDTGSRLATSGASVSRRQPRAVSRFREMAADPAHRHLTAHAELLRARLGPYLPLDQAHAALREYDIEPDGLTAHVLLDLAGPYTLDGHRWIHTTDPDGSTLVAHALDALFDAIPAPTCERPLSTLTDLGMPAAAALTYLDTRVALRTIGNVRVRWNQENTATMAEAVLHALNTPATVDAIHALFDPGTAAPATVKAILIADPRFVRITRLAWGLRAWNLPEYRSIPHTIGAVIDDAGGQATAADIVTEVAARLPDVSEISIRKYLSTAPFVLIGRGATIRRRTPDDPPPRLPPLNTVRGVFRNGSNEIRLQIPVTTDLQRGSGLQVHRALARALGVEVGERRRFENPRGPVQVAWRANSTNGASLSALRRHADAVAAHPGDHLVIAFHLDADTVTITRLDRTLSGRQRLNAILGRPVHSPVDALAESLDCPPTHVAELLQSRREADLLDGRGAHAPQRSDQAAQEP